MQSKISLGIMKVFIPTVLLSVSALVFFERTAFADTVYLKNGRRMEGIITKERDNGVYLDVGFGTVKITWAEIEDIKRSTPAERLEIRKKWAERRKKEEKEWLKRQERLKKKKETTTAIDFSSNKEHIIVKAILNRKVEANLLLDTGATLVLLSKAVADKVKKEAGLTEGDIIEMKTADGTRVKARLILLNSVSVKGMEAKDVISAVLLEEKEDIGDGILGMSFLNKFNFQVDNASKKLILKRLDKAEGGKL